MVECVNCVKFKECNFSNPYLQECVDYQETQTNEQWIKQCTTEQLAELLYKFYCDGRNDELQRYVSINEKSFVEWLKQPHTEKE